MNVSVEKFDRVLFDSGHANGLVFKVDGLTSPVDAEAAAQVMKSLVEALARRDA